jgi:hypothetical protein
MAWVYSMDKDMRNGTGTGYTIQYRQLTWARGVVGYGCPASLGQDWEGRASGWACVGGFHNPGEGNGLTPRKINTLATSVVCTECHAPCSDPDQHDSPVLCSSAPLLLCSSSCRDRASGGYGDGDGGGDGDLATYACIPFENPRLLRLRSGRVPVLMRDSQSGSCGPRALVAE